MTSVERKSDFTVAYLTNTPITNTVKNPTTEINVTLTVHDCNVSLSLNPK